MSKYEHRERNSPQKDSSSGGIGTLTEQPLHAALKESYRRPGDAVEAPVEGFVVDLVRGRELVEIQTRSFSSMRRKLDHLLDRHRLRLVHPIAAQTWIERVDEDGQVISRRKSPKRGIGADVCPELTSFPTLLGHPHFVLELAMVSIEEIRRPDPKAWRSKGWRTSERRLLGVQQQLVLSRPEDLVTLLPSGLPDPFTTADIARSLGRSRHVARAVAYCLRKAGVLSKVGRSKTGIEYRRTRRT